MNNDKVHELKKAIKNRSYDIDKAIAALAEEISEHPEKWLYGDKS